MEKRGKEGKDGLTGGEGGKGGGWIKERGDRVTEGDLTVRGWRAGRFICDIPCHHICRCLLKFAACS